jgi:hypothetical protein
MENYTEIDKMIIFLELLPDTFRDKEIMKDIIKLIRSYKKDKSILEWIDETIEINKKYRDDMTLESVHEFYLGRIDALNGIKEKIEELM